MEHGQQHSAARTGTLFKVGATNDLQVKPAVQSVIFKQRIMRGMEKKRLGLPGVRTNIMEHGLLIIIHLLPYHISIINIIIIRNKKQVPERKEPRIISTTRKSRIWLAFRDSGGYETGLLEKNGKLFNPFYCRHLNQWPTTV
jgi:hypothetical protein